MKISVIICTKNRSQGLAECIKFVITQSFSPNELIIVDASDTENLDIKDDSRFTYIHAKLPLTHSRNLGVKNSSGDVVLFLDDDVALDKNFIKEIVKVFEKDLEKKIGGVTGNIVDIQRSKSFKLHMHSVVNRIFLLPTSGNGRFRASGCPTFIHGTKEVRNVEFLSGCCMAYRKEVFEDFKFDEDFPNAMFTDDEDFSYRVSRRYQNVYTPYAKVVHNSSPIGRDSHYTKAKMTVEARYYLLKKNFPQTLKYTLAFWWSVVGYFI